MPSVRAHIDCDNVIVVMPGHFPLQSVSRLSIEFGRGQTLSLDVSQVEQQVTGRLVEVRYLLLGGPTVGQQNGRLLALTPPVGRADVYRGHLSGLRAMGYLPGDGMGGE
jgi:hypothetical protein